MFTLTVKGTVLEAVKSMKARGIPHSDISKIWDGGRGAVQLVVGDLYQKNIHEWFGERGEYPYSPGTLLIYVQE